MYLINFLMMASVYFKFYEFEWFHLLVPVGFVLLILLDQTKIYPEEIDYAWKRGKIPRDLYKKINEIYDILINTKEQKEKS